MTDVTRSKIKTKYSKHYWESDQFIIQADAPHLIQVVLDREDAIELVGDLLKYILEDIYES